MRKKTNRRGLLYGAGGTAAVASVLLLVTMVTPRPADMNMNLAAAVPAAQPATARVLDQPASPATADTPTSTVTPVTDPGGQQGNQQQDRSYRRYAARAGRA